ncbi:MAG: hypothetical protein IT422_05255 [Pirellulaceae bacterium]|nr:hypothetical protein [Pirellulaceae bacterium]
MAVDLNPYAPPPDSESLQLDQEQWLSDRVWRDGNLMVIGRGAELRPRCLVTGIDTDCSADVWSYWQPRWVYLLLLLWCIPYFVIAPFVRRYLRLKVPIAPVLLAKRQRQSTRARFIAVYAAVGLAFLYQWNGAGVWFLPLLSALGLVFFVAVAFARAPLVGLQIERIDDETLTLRNLPKRCLEGLPDWPPSQALNE